MEFYGDAVAGWENTLHILSNRGTGSSVEDRNLITEMDPDAPGRQPGKRLHPVDREDEIRLLRSVFSRLRCGQLEEAQQLCFRAGQPHRAALLEGWKLFHDPNMRMASEISNLKGVIFASIIQHGTQHYIFLYFFMDFCRTCFGESLP